MTPKAKGTLSADSYLHVTMEVSAFTTARRYPQIFVSDAEAPVQWNLPSANTVIVETFLDMPTKGVPSGPVTITFGDVLYHSGVDPTFSCYENNLKVASFRHYDNLGFKSGAEGPSWNEQQLPCFTSGTFGGPR
jgi:hypothetical protein